MKMSKLIICCGVMGCGKTTFAKKYAIKFGYEYIDFDKEYHKKIQKEHIITPIEDVPKILERLSNHLNKNADKVFICDNWFKWHKDWWQDEEDNTLQELQQKLKFHNIEVFNISIPFAKAYERYIGKNKEKYLIRQENYKQTMKERQKNLNSKIFKWAIQ